MVKLSWFLDRAYLDTQPSEIDASKVRGIEIQNPEQVHSTVDFLKSRNQNSKFIFIFNFNFTIQSTGTPYLEDEKLI